MCNVADENYPVDIRTLTVSVNLFPFPSLGRSVIAVQFEVLGNEFAWWTFTSLAVISLQVINLFDNKDKVTNKNFVFLVKTSRYAQVYFTAANYSMFILSSL